MYIIQQTGRNRKESLIPLRSNLEDLKIEILDASTMSGFTVIDSGYEEVVEVVTSDEGSEDGNSRPRKRAKLDHLTVEQKAQHRKMMNRISAQSARDRQRALMMQQEESLKRLTASMDQMKEENKMLKKKNEVLQSENVSMKSLATENEKLKSLVEDLELKLKSVEESHEKCLEVSVNAKIESSCSSSEPAVPNFVPLPKGLELQLILIFTLMIWKCSNGILTLQKLSDFSKIFHKRSLAKTPSLQLLRKLWTREDVQELMMKWFSEYHRQKPPD